MKFLFKKRIFYLVNTLTATACLSSVLYAITEEGSLAPSSFFSEKEMINVSEKVVSFVFDSKVSDSYSKLIEDIELEPQGGGEIILQTPLKYALTDMIIGPLKKKEAIMSFGFASCTGIIIKGKHNKSGKDVFALIHLYPENFIAEFYTIMKKLKDLGVVIDNLGVFTSLDSVEKKDPNSPITKFRELGIKAIESTPDFYPELFDSKNFKGIFIERNPGFIKKLIISSQKVTASSGAYKKAKLSLKWNKICSLNQSISMEKRGFNILSRIFSFLKTPA